MTSNGRCNESPYILEFEDNFDGTNLDTSKWVAFTGVARDLKHNISKQWYTPKNIEVSNGTLKLISKRDTFINQCYNTYFNNSVQTNCEDFYFSAAEIDSRKTFGHGRIEIACKIPNTRGIGSSFWTFSGPPSNEVDIFEFETETNTFNKYDASKTSKIHHMNSRTNFDEDSRVEDCTSHYKGRDFSESFHVFSIVWTPNKLEWYVDGELKRKMTLFYTMLGQPVDCNGLCAEKQYILNRTFPMNAMNIILDNIIHVGSKAPDDGSVFPCYFEIDYVRYYRQQY